MGFCFLHMQYLGQTWKYTELPTSFEKQNHSRKSGGSVPEPAWAGGAAEVRESLYGSRLPLAVLREHTQPLSHFQVFQLGV